MRGFGWKKNKNKYEKYEEIATEYAYLFKMIYKKNENAGLYLRHNVKNLPRNPNGQQGHFHKTHLMYYKRQFLKVLAIQATILDKSNQLLGDFFYLKDIGESLPFGQKDAFLYFEISEQHFPKGPP